MILEINEQGIKVLNKKCWMCPSGDTTNHHALPQYLKPRLNVEIPLCRECHDKLHGQDINCLIAFAYKIKKILGEGINRINSLKNLIKQKKEKTEEMTIGDIVKK